MSAAKLASIATLSLFFMAGCGGNGSQSSEFPTATKMALDSAVDGLMNKFDTPGMVVSVSIPGQGSYFAVRGVSNEATSTPMTGYEHFRIGSITKTVTLTAILILADEKKLDLDDSVSKYLDFVPNGENITLRMLGNMTSGLYSYTADEAWVAEIFTNPEKVWRPRQLVNVAFSHEAPNLPGTSWDYVNTNTVLLGMVIEKITGKPVQDFFSRRIFTPLGMFHTSWPTDGQIPAPFAHGVTRQTVDDSRADATNRNPSWAFTAGQLISTLNDLKIWVRSYATGALISSEMQTERLKWVTLPPNTPERRYGLGIGEDAGWLGHTGELPGYNAGAYYLPELDATIVTIFNSDIPTDNENPVPATMKALTTILTPTHITH